MESGRRGRRVDEGFPLALPEERGAFAHGGEGVGVAGCIGAAFAFGSVAGFVGAGDGGEVGAGVVGFGLRGGWYLCWVVRREGGVAGARDGVCGFPEWNVLRD